MASNLEDRKNFLVNIVSGSLFSEPRFSSEGDPQAKVIADLVAEVAEKDPEFILKLALYVRDDLNIRSTANFLLALAANTDGCHPFLAKYYPAIIRLPSDWLDVVALYYLLPDRKLQSRGLPTSLRKAMADRFRNFDGYQLGKYNKENSAKRKRRREKKKLLEQAGSSSSSSGLFGDDEEDDIASSADDDDATKKRYPITIKQMIRQLHINEPVLQVMCVLGKKYPANEEDFRRSRLNGLFERERAGSRMKLPVPETWETLLSSMGNTAQAWEQLIDKRKLPFMAMLRNLRNILLTGVSKRHHNWVLSKLRDEKTIANSRQFPFSFFTAYEAINIKPEDLGGAPNAQELASLTPQQRAMKLKKLAKKKVFRMPAADLIERYRQALDTALKHATVHNVKPIKGRTLVICSASDVMKNTNLTGKRVGSFKSLQEIALLLGLMCKFVCEDCTFFLMDRSDSPRELQLVDGTILDNMTRAIATASSLSSGPNEFPIAFLEKATDSKSRIDNIIVLSNETFGRGANDLEAQIPGGLTMLLDKYRTEVNSELLFVSVNLNSKAAKMGDNSHPKNVSIYGFSDAILRFVAERGDGCQLEYIQTIDQEKKLDQRKKKKEDSLLSSWSSLSFSSASSSTSSSRGSRLGGQKDSENASAVAPSSLVDPRSENEARWTNAKVFVSSTFKDMHGERDILARHVFPELQRRCKRNRINLTYVDLRWGVTEEEASSSIEICLTQVHDAFFLGMLGERYGWAPSQYNVSSPDDPKLSWLKEYPTNRSITELEIHCGAFLGRSVKSVFFIRDPSVVSQVPESHRKDFQCDGGADVAQKLRDLKERVERDFSHTGNVFHYDGQWGGVVDGKPILSGLDTFASYALQSLWSQICEVHLIEDPEDEYGNEDADDEEEFDLDSHYQDLKVHHDAYAFERYKCFAGRKTITDRIIKTLDNIVDRKGVIVVHGEPGAGKSAILAHLSSHYRKVRPHATVISHFVGSAPGSTNIRDTLHRISWEISLALRPDETPELPVDYNELKKAFARLLKEAEFESIVLIIDGLNQLSDAFQAHSLDWIPDEVPLPIVVSTYTDAVSHCVLRANPSSTCIAIGPLNENEQRDMVRRILAEHYKKLDESPSNNQMRMLIKKRDASKPLYLAVACEELRLIGTYEQLNENIKRFAPSMPMLLASVMKRLEEDHERNFQHFPKLINTIFSLIICSRDGLSQKEIFESLAIKQYFLDAQSSSSSGSASRFGAKHKQQLELDQHRFKEVLTEGQWLRLLFSLGGYLRIAGETNEGVIYDFFHQVFKQTAEKRYVGAKEKATPTHKILATMFLKRADPTGDYTFASKDARAISELPYHLLLAKMWPQLVSTLSSIHFICTKTRLGMTFGLLRDYSAVLFQEQSSSSSSGFFEQQISSSSINENDRAQIVEYYRFLLSNLTVITETPSLLLQQAANQPDDTLPAIEALKAIEAAKSNGPKHWIKWLNKPQDIDRCLVNMSGFGEPIMGCCFSPDGKFVACGSRDRVVRVFDSHSGSEICSLRGHTHWVVACAFSASNSQLLATGSWDSTVKIWDIETRSLLHTLTGHSRRVSCVAFSHDGKFVLSGSWDCSFIVWRADTGEKVFQLKGQDKPINCLAWSSDDKIVAIGLWSGDVLLYNAEKDFTPYLEPIKDAHDQSVRSVAFSPVREADPSGNRPPLLLLSSSTDGSMKVWNIDDMDAHSAILNAHSQSVNACAFSADGKHVATASDDQTIAIWDILGGTESLCFQPGKEDPFVKEKKQRKTDNKPVSAFDFSASLSAREENVGFPTCISSFGSNLLAVAMNDCTIQLWDLKKMRRVQKFSGHQHTITSVRFIDEDTLISSSEDNSVCIWTVGNAHPVALSENHRAYANCVAVNPPNSSGSKYEVVSVSDDSSIIYYPEATIVQSIASSSGGAFVGDSKTFTQKSAILSCALSPDSSLGTQFVVGSRDGIARVYRQRSNISSSSLGWNSSSVNIQQPLGPIAVALTLEGHRDWVTNVSYSPAGSKICTGSFDFTLAIWDAETGEKLHNLLGHTGGVIGHAWSPDSKIIASCSFDGTIRQWSAETGKLIVTILAHSQRVTGIVWTEDGKTLITSSEDGSVKIWTASSGILVTNLQGHVRPVQSLAFSPDASRVVSSSEDCSLRIWDTSEIKLDVSASKKPIVASRLSADGKLLFNAYRDGKATVHSTSSSGTEGLKIVQEIKDFSLAHAADFHSDSQGNGTFVLINGYDAEMVFYDTVRDSPLAHFALSSASVVSSTRFSPQGDLLAVGQWNGNLQVFPIRRMLSDSASSKKGRGSSSSSSRSNVMGTSSPLCTLRHPNWVNSIIFSSDNAKLLSSCHDATVRLWDINRKTTTETFYLNDCALFANFGVSRAGSDTNLIVYGGTGSTINLRDTRSSSGSSVNSLSLPKSTRVFDCQANIDENLAVSVSEDRVVRLWDLRSEGQPLSMFHTTGVPRALSFVAPFISVGDSLANFYHLHLETA